VTGLFGVTHCHFNLQAVTAPPRMSGCYDADKLAIFRAFDFKLHFAFRSREQSVVFANAYVSTSMESCATLTNNDIASQDMLAAVFFDTQTFGYRIAAVTGATTCLFMCHDLLLGD